MGSIPAGQQKNNKSLQMIIHRRKYLLAKQLFFQRATNRMSNLTPAGVICLRTGGLADEWGINAALSSDWGTRRFHLPPSSFCRKVNPVAPPASRGPEWRAGQDWIKTHGETEISVRKVWGSFKPHVLHTIWWDICRCWSQNKPLCGCWTPCVQTPCVMYLSASPRLYLLLH